MLNENINKYGYHIFPNRSSKSDINQITSELSHMQMRRTPLSEQDQSVWWNEISIPSSSNVAHSLLDDKCRAEIETEYSKIKKTAFWANRYKVGEYIPKHSDDTGDLQLLMALIIPPRDNGGIYLFININTLKLSS